MLGSGLPPLMDLEIPATLQGSLLARLDALGPAKFVAQLASVIGRTFSFDLLVRVSGMDPTVLAGFLDRVVASGLVRHGSDETDEGLIFKHVLVQEVAYESLLRRNRRTIHERVARERKPASPPAQVLRSKRWPGTTRPPVCSRSPSNSFNWRPP